MFKMKKVIIIISCVLAIFTLVTNKIQVKSKSVQEDIASKIIRFHVIANSDLKDDQALKLRVRDKVIEYMQPRLKNSKNIEESRKIIKESDKEIVAIANEVIKENGYNYSVKTTLSDENFPIKTYGNITLPPGKYQAYRIIIGEGKGQNWWCVMFPPLCFVDITKGEVSYKETEKEMKSVLSQDEYKIVNNQLNKPKDNEIKFEFKILEILKGKKDPAK
jgi:stage II sporulation protein R